MGLVALPGHGGYDVRVIPVESHNYGFCTIIVRDKVMLMTGIETQDGFGDDATGQEQK